MAWWRRDRDLPSAECRAYVALLLKLDEVMLAAGQQYMRAADDGVSELTELLKSDRDLPPALRQELETRTADLKSWLWKFFTDEKHAMDYREVLFRCHRMVQYIDAYVRGETPALRIPTR